MGIKLHSFAHILCLAFLIMLLIVFTGAAQAPQLFSAEEQTAIPVSAEAQQGGSHPIYIPRDPIADVPLLTQRQLRALNVARQKSLVSDTDKLLKLTGELNDKLNKSGIPVRDDLRKVSEIEKLAHSVKDKMGQNMQNPSTGPDPFSR